MRTSWYPFYGKRGPALFLVLFLALASCGHPVASVEDVPPADGGGGSVLGAVATPTFASSPSAEAPRPAELATPDADQPAASPTAFAAAPLRATPTPFFETSSPPCGQLLPILSGPALPATSISPDEALVAELASRMPEAARPAFERILAAPQTVGLVAYRVGQESQGVFLNPDAPMPLASVVKVIHLVAYVEAIASGQFDPAEMVSLEALDNYYLPGLDLGAHAKAVAELEEEERIVGSPPRLRLDEIPWMMIRHSSNAAMDYLHMRLGQERIEETAIQLGLTTHSAPCPFLGQFLSMSDSAPLGSGGLDSVRLYVADPEQYGRDVMMLTEAFSLDPAFRQRASSRRQRPSLETQRYFTEHLHPQASAADYAALMARIAQNGLQNDESSFLARRYLEWPMRFPVNQALFSNLGYKNGSMPGVLTTVYYAYPKGEIVPVVVALFYRDLPNRTYQQWRRNVLAHDELARWLLIEPSAIPMLRAALSGG